MQSGFAVPGKGDAVDVRVFRLAFLQLRFNGLQDDISRCKILCINIFPQRPATFAVNAVKRADFHIDRGNIDSQGAAQTAAVDWSESDGFPEEHRG